MTNDPFTDPDSRVRRWPDYSTLWRWHFYAGVFCIPLVLVLSVTGTIYLFRPQIETWQERKYDQIALNGRMRPLDEQIVAAVEHIEGSRFASCQLPSAPEPREEFLSATRVFVERDGERVRVYVNPIGPKVLGSVAEEERFIRVVRRIHGELLIGKRGSYLVELTASWTIVMVITGALLWWPRHRRLAGVVYPRLNQRGKVFWKDLHSVGGVWVSALVLLLILSGLPWSTFWGDYFKFMRGATGTASAQQDWQSGHHPESHTSHSGGDSTSEASPGEESSQDSQNTGGASSWRAPAPNPSSYRLKEIDRVAVRATSLELRPPVLLSPPTDGDSLWTIKSETANRPHRQTVRFDAASGTIASRERFEDQHWIDQIVGQGIAIHEGQRFGWLNQLLALAATTGLVTLSLTGLVLWWRRRNVGGLSPPTSAAGQSRSAASTAPRRIAFAAIVTALAIYLPLFGLSFAAVWILERTVLRRLPGVSAWLGLSAANRTGSGV